MRAAIPWPWPVSGPGPANACLPSNTSTSRWSKCCPRGCTPWLIRNSIVEVGNLAPAGPGQARWLIMTVTALLHHAGYRHVVFTAVPALYNAFRRMGLQPVALGRADPVRLGPGSRDDWGAYYRMEPMVYGGDIAHGYQHIESSLSMSQPHLISLWRQAAELGRDDHRVYCPWRLPNGRVIQ